MRELSFFDPSLRRRLLLGAVLSVGGVVAALPSAVRALAGGRFQRVDGVIVDVWLHALLTFGGCATAAVCGAAIGPLWQRRWPAGLAAALCSFPLALTTAARLGAPGLRLRPYDWGLSALVALAVGAIIVAEYRPLSAQARAGYVWARARRLARRRRAAG